MESGTHSCCHPAPRKIDYLLWISLSLVLVLYGYVVFFEESTRVLAWYNTLAISVFDLLNTMWWGITLGIIMLSVLTQVPREFVISILGSNTGFRGILRATAAGVLLDLCSHGILMVAAKLYERGASIGQVIAFLIASPWNSFSLTLILFSLIGFWWTLSFIGLSMLAAVCTGMLFDALARSGKIPENFNTTSIPENFKCWHEAKRLLSQTQFGYAFFLNMLQQGISESRMVLRWILFGILLASLIRTFVSPEYFGTYFGPTLAGLGLTVLVATIIEVCSEGSVPIATDLLNRANAPGNGFAFLMAGVSTDSTEIMVLKDTTGNLKTALFLPLLTVPQVIFIAWLMNLGTLL